jgi:segregation and condensation protein A
MSGIIDPMNLSPLAYQTNRYLVATPIFEGPLDLLLHLIERAELDITKLALAQVTDQYIAHIRNMPELPAEEVSAFLVIAAKLLQIKSEALLPRPPVREEGEEDPGEALARQLMIYRQFKKIADRLEEQELAGRRTYLRLASPPKIETTLDLTGIGLPDLVEAARSLLLRVDERSELKTVVTPPTVTIRQKISLIASLLRQHGRATFQKVLQNTKSRIEIVVTFLAMLELVKRHLIQVQQDSLFGEIELEQSSQWDENEEFELEFGE